MDQRLALYEQRAIDSGTSRRPQLTTRAKGVNTHRREAPSAEISGRPKDGRTTPIIPFGSFMTDGPTLTSERKLAPSKDDYGCPDGS